MSPWSRRLRRWSGSTTRCDVPRQHPYRQASSASGSSPLASSYGVDLRTVQKWMGHEDINTTMRYAQFVPENLLNAASVLEPSKPDLRVVE